MVRIMYDIPTTRLYEIRENHDLKQREIAKILNVHIMSYSQWENNNRFIPLNELSNYCNTFNVSMDYVFYLTNNKEKTNNIKELNKKEIGNRLNTILKDNNLTQCDLARFLNTTQSTISAYINGKTLILMAFAYQIANKKLDVEIRKIYDESKKRYGSPKITKVLESGGIKVSQKRNHSFHIWLSDDEYINLKKRSLNSGLSISDIFRLALKGQPV